MLLPKHNPLLPRRPAAQRVQHDRVTNAPLRQAVQQLLRRRRRLAVDIENQVADVDAGGVSRTGGADPDDQQRAVASLGGCDVGISTGCTATPM